MLNPALTADKLRITAPADPGLTKATLKLGELKKNLDLHRCMESIWGQKASKDANNTVLCLQVSIKVDTSESRSIVRVGRKLRALLGHCRMLNSMVFHLSLQNSFFVPPPPTKRTSQH